ncbi:MAG: class I adenylate-forming enzyme family protein, partial [Rubrivivax sp.]
MLPVARWIHAVAERAPSALALQAADGDLDYAAFAGRIDAVATALAAAGIGAGDRVAWLGLNSAGLLATLFACAARGAILAPLNWRLAPPEHRALLERTAPALLVAEEPWLAACAEPGSVPQGTRCVAKVDADQPVPAGWQRWDEFVGSRAHGIASAPFEAAAAAQDPQDPQAPLLLSFTSGSTGEPKGVLLSHRAWAANGDASVDMHALTERDRVLTTLPLFHVGGLN